MKYLIPLLLIFTACRTVERTKTETTEIVYIDTIIPGAEIKTRLFLPTLDTIIFRDGLKVELKTIGDSLDLRASKEPVKVQVKKTTKRKTQTKIAKPQTYKEHWFYQLLWRIVLIFSIYWVCREILKNLSISLDKSKNRNK